MKVLNQSYEMVGIEDVRTHPRNARRGDTAAIRQSMEASGFWGALIVQRSTRYVLAGNHRLIAAIEVGLTEVPVVWVDVDDDRAMRILLADNATADRAGWHDAQLVDLLQDLAATDAGLMGSGFTDAELALLLERIAGQAPPEPRREILQDEAPTMQEAPTRAQPGDLWRLGEHRLACGDSCKNDPWERLGVADAAMMFTDPPYGVSYQTDQAAVLKRRTDGLEVVNDDLQPEETRVLVAVALTQAGIRLRPGGSFYVCSPPGDMAITLRGAVADAGLRLRQVIVWVKDAFVFGRQDYHWRHEDVIYGWKDGAAHYFVDDRTQNTVWEIPRPRRSEEHPTMKPVELVARALANNTRTGDAVLDPFAGSGTTLIAAEQMERRCYAIEIEPRYADVILTRWEALTGATAEREEPDD